MHFDLHLPADQLLVLVQLQLHALQEKERSSQALSASFEQWVQ